MGSSKPILPRGFTLIELMIVVAIVGILAVLAVFGVRRYVNNAKTAEARNSLGQMGKDQAAAYERESMPGAVLTPGSTASPARSLCVSPTAPVPATASQIRGRKYQSNAGGSADWNADEGAPQTGFACLNFTMDEPQYYMYNFVTSSPPNIASATWKAFANGDLNGDGVLSTFELDGVIQPSLSFSLAPNLSEVTPGE